MTSEINASESSILASLKRSGSLFSLLALLDDLDSLNGLSVKAEPLPLDS